MKEKGMKENGVEKGMLQGQAPLSASLEAVLELFAFLLVEIFS